MDACPGGVGMAHLDIGGCRRPASGWSFTETLETQASNVTFCLQQGAVRPRAPLRAICGPFAQWIR